MPSPDRESSNLVALLGTMARDRMTNCGDETPTGHDVGEDRAGCVVGDRCGTHPLTTPAQSRYGAPLASLNQWPAVVAGQNGRKLAVRESCGREEMCWVRRWARQTFEWSLIRALDGYGVPESSCGSSGWRRRRSRCPCA